MMKQFTLAILLLLPLAAVPREKYNARPLSEIAIAALQGKRLAVSRHEMRELPIVPLNRQSAEWHAFRKIKADPSDLFERELAPAIAKRFGMEPIQSQADADYLLDILVTDRRYFNTPDLKAAFYLRKKQFWSGFGVRVKLKFRETDMPVFVGNCYSDTLEHPTLTGEGELAAYAAAHPQP